MNQVDDSRALGERYAQELKSGAALPDWRVRRIVGEVLEQDWEFRRDRRRSEDDSAWRRARFRWELVAIALVWFCAVGAAAWGFTIYINDHLEGADVGLLLGMVYLGAYKLAGWSIDVLQQTIAQGIVWPLLGDKTALWERRQTFNINLRHLRISGRNRNLGKIPEYEGKLEEIERHLRSMSTTLGSIQHRSQREKLVTSEPPPRELQAAKMFDLSEFDHPIPEGTHIRMPDGKWWVVSSDHGPPDATGYYSYFIYPGSE